MVAVYFCCGCSQMVDNLKSVFDGVTEILKVMVSFIFEMSTSTKIT